MNIFKSLFAFWFDGSRNTGANLDIRPSIQQRKDYKFEETVAMANPVVWVEKPQDIWRKFPEQDQHGTFACVANTIKKMMGVYYFIKTGTYVEFSASHIYQRRPNKPWPGMSGIDALDIARQGVTLEILSPSDQKDDKAMDALKVEPYKQSVGEVFALQNYLTVDPGNIDTIASIIQTTGKAVMVWFYFKAEEWSPFAPVLAYPTLQNHEVGVLRHSVTAVDFTLYNGEKSLVIEDSAHFGGLARRVVSNSFFTKRNLFAAFIMGFKFDDQIISPTPIEPVPAVSQKPIYIFKTNLQFTSAYSINPDVIALQDCLKYEGLFPTNIASTGYYGSISCKAVLSFQKKYQLASDAELDILGGETVDPKTRVKLNEIYGK